MQLLRGVLPLAHLLLGIGLLPIFVDKERSEGDNAGDDIGCVDDGVRCEKKTNPLTKSHVEPMDGQVELTNGELDIEPEDNPRYVDFFPATPID